MHFCRLFNSLAKFLYRILSTKFSVSTTTVRSTSPRLPLPVLRLPASRLSLIVRLGLFPRVGQFAADCSALRHVSPSSVLRSTELRVAYELTELWFVCVHTSCIPMYFTYGCVCVLGLFGARRTFHCFVAVTVRYMFINLILIVSEYRCGIS